MVIRMLRHFVLPICVLLLVSVSPASGATVTGTVTNGTNGRPSAGDMVVLVDVQAGMAEAASATTDSRGHYSLESPGMGAYLVRVNHQGGTYFIAAPQGNVPGDITVYDVAAKVDGIAIDADMLLVEAAGTMLRIQERYLVRNTSLPPKAQFSKNTFEIALPSGAQLDSAAATRPGGLATNTRLTPLESAGHYTFNIPIQPDQGEKETIFEVQYHLPYSGKYSFTPHLQMTADNLVIYVPSGMSFVAGPGSTFHQTQEDPRVQTFVAKGVRPGQGISFEISGEGQMPRDSQGPRMAQQPGGAMGDASEAGGRPGGGLGIPIDTPDPLTKYKWWLLGGMTIVLAMCSFVFLRNRSANVNGISVPSYQVRPKAEMVPAFVRSIPHTVPEGPAHPAEKAYLLNVIKDELFEIESEKLSGVISESEYAEVKTGLQAVLKRALKVKQEARSS